MNCESEVLLILFSEDMFFNCLWTRSNLEDEYLDGYDTQSCFCPTSTEPLALFMTCELYEGTSWNFVLGAVRALGEDSSILNLFLEILHSTLI